MSFSDADRRRILEETRELLEQRYRIRAEQEQHSAYEPSQLEDEDAVAATINQPIERLNDRHRREIDEQEARFEQERAERRAAQRKREERQREAERAPEPVDWAVVSQLINAAILVERERVGEILMHLIAQMRDEQREEIERASAKLDAEVREARAAVADFKAALQMQATTMEGCVVRRADGVIDVAASMRKQNELFTAAMRNARAAKVDITIDAEDVLDFTAAKRSTMN